MKKNMLAVVILAATIVNIALTVLMLFTIIPKAQRTDDLIKKIVTILDLELENPDAADYAEVPFEDREVYALAESVNVNLARLPEDKKNTYAQVNVSLVLNNKAKSYKTVQPLLINYEPIIKSIVTDVVAPYNAENVLANKADMQREILRRLRTEFEDADLMVGVTLTITY